MRWKVTLCRVEAPASFFQMAALMAPMILAF
jgi:hypothetical protein